MTVSEMVKLIKETPGLAGVIEGMPGSRIGTVVPAGEETLRGLTLAGITGVNGGLTIKGSVAAARLQADHLDRVFG